MTSDHIASAENQKSEDEWQNFWGIPKLDQVCNKIPEFGTFAISVDTAAKYDMVADIYFDKMKVEVLKTGLRVAALSWGDIAGNTDNEKISDLDVLFVRVELGHESQIEKIYMDLNSYSGAAFILFHDAPSISKWFEVSLVCNADESLLIHSRTQEKHAVGELFQVPPVGYQSNLKKDKKRAVHKIKARIFAHGFGDNSKTYLSSLFEVSAVDLVIVDDLQDCQQIKPAAELPHLILINGFSGIADDLKTLEVMSQKNLVVVRSSEITREVDRVMLYQLGLRAVLDYNSSIQEVAAVALAQLNVKTTPKKDPLVLRNQEYFTKLKKAHRKVDASSSLEEMVNIYAEPLQVLFDSSSYRDLTPGFIKLSLPELDQVDIKFQGLIQNSLIISLQQNLRNYDIVITKGASTFVIVPKLNRYIRVALFQKLRKFLTEESIEFASISQSDVEKGALEYLSAKILDK